MNLTRISALVAGGFALVSHAMADDESKPYQMSFTRGASNTWNADWIAPDSGPYDATHRTFFFQWSLDLVQWHYAPFLEFGPGLKSYGIDTQGEPKCFVRLKCADELSIESLEQARDADFDLDGIRNSFEVELFGTDPFVKNAVEDDSDGDGLPDAWEASFLDWLNLHGIPASDIAPLADYDGDGLTNAEEFMLGTNPYLLDSDGDGLHDGEDPDPLVALIQAIEMGFSVLSVME